MKVIPRKWIQEPKHGDGFLEAEFNSCVFDAPVPVETHHVELSEVKLGEVQKFSFVLEAAGNVAVYKDETDYAQKSGSSMAAESYIPSGLFSPSGDPNFKKTPTAIFHGRVSKTYDNPAKLGFGESDQLVSFTIEGEEFDAVVPKAVAELGNVAVGNIVCGVFWVQGWPEDD